MEKGDIIEKVIRLEERYDSLEKIIDAKHSGLDKRIGFIENSVVAVIIGIMLLKALGFL